MCGECLATYCLASNETESRRVNVRIAGLITKNTFRRR